MLIVFPIYDQFTTLDLVGPIEVLSLLPDVEVKVVAIQRGIVWPDNAALPVIAPFALDEIAHADVLIVPGGTGTLAAREDRQLVEWIARIDQTSQWTCSVCTGSLLLGAAGLLNGKPATTHWAMLDALRVYGAEPVTERWVRSDKVITAAGVSAGIDMALQLAALVADEQMARAIQLAIEYDPAPPFTAGSPETAGADIVGAVAEGQTALTTRPMRTRPNLGFLTQ